MLEESRAYAAHAERTSVSLDDVKLAIAAKLETQFVPPTSAEDMKAYADAVNAVAAFRGRKSNVGQDYVVGSAGIFRKLENYLQKNKLTLTSLFRSRKINRDQSKHLTL